MSDREIREEARTQSATAITRGPTPRIAKRTHGILTGTSRA
jgi:hypothetical protein